MKQFPRKFLYSLLIVLAWLGFVVEGSHALLVSATSLTGSTITTSTTSLLVSNSQSGSSTLFSDVRPGFAFTITPGDKDEKYFLLKNASTSKSGLDIDVIAAVPDTTSDLYKAVTIQITPVDATGTPTGTMSQMALASLTQLHLNMLSTINQGETQRYKVATYLEPTYSGQGQSTAFDLIFTGTQHNG